MHVALLQLRSTRDVTENLEVVRRLARRAAAEGARWILTPENAGFLGPDREKSSVAQDESGPIVTAFRELAAELDCWVTVGSYPERHEIDPDRTYNTQLLVDPHGAVTARYRKMHLFDVELDDETRYRESRSIAPGREIVAAPVTVGPDTVEVGLSTCYDLRFPELYRALLDRGATALTVPSAFTEQTGPPHWHALLRARAIENQCYVLAPAQWGEHYPGRRTFGHSAVYDPWGQRVACASDGVRVVHAHLDFDYLEDVRSRIPCGVHRILETRTPDDREGDTAT